MEREIADRRYEMSDREALEIGAKSCFNQFVRVLDKFTEATFILALTALGVWNFISQFIVKKATFSVAQSLLSIYLLGAAALLSLSLKNNLTVLTYFGFMRGKLTKSLFLLFCSCMTMPGSDG